MRLVIVLPISRKAYLHRVFDSLEYMICPPDTNILGIVDGDMELYEIARNFILTSKFKERLCIARNSQPAVTINQRRQRISDIHNEAKKYIQEADTIFLAEDDTVYHPFALRNLFDVYREYPYAGFVTGVQVGRWDTPYLGIWNADDVYNPQKLTSSALYTGVQQVHASGIYCMLTKAKTYLKHKFEPYQEVLGPDVNYGLWLCQQGYKNYANYNVKCTHIGLKGDIPVKEVTQVVFTKSDNIWKLA